MSKLVVLNLGAGNLNDGFPNVIAQLRLKDGKIEQFIGSLPPAPELATLNQQWQLLYYALHQRFDVARRRLFEVEEQGVTNISTATFQELCQEIETKFNLWFDSPSFLKVDRKLRTKLDQNEEVQIIIETGDRTLHRFPWHLWHFLDDYQQAEIGLSNLEYSPINLEKKPRNKPRILTILGHSEGINVKADQALIAQINNAEIVFLVEPKSAEFHEILWDEKGWDILFFAGHSHTENHQGIIFINPQESLNIKELKTAINKAIKQGLQLAIFNSCDGIGLAEELSKLNLPQIIVMREGVPDLIAQEFLKYFLSALQQNKSVFCSLREARERLQAWDKDFPGGSWLPMICQNLSTFNLEIKLEQSLKIFPNLSVDFWHQKSDIDLDDTIFYKKINETNLLVKLTDITSLNVDIIVSSDDTYLKMGGGVSGAILRKAGKNVKEETIKLAPIKLGDVAITNAGNLSAKYIFHGAVLDYQLYYKLKSQKPDISVIQKVTEKCLKLAESVNAQSIAFPALATGMGQLAPEQSALGIMIEIIKVLKLSTSLKTIIIAIYAPKDNNLDKIQNIKSRFLNQVSHFIDLYQQMETRYELLEDLENIFKSYNIELAENIIVKYQEKLNDIMNKYINNISNNFE